MNAEARLLAVLDEYMAALRAGRAPDRAALLAAHPDLAESLAASFRALDFVHGAARTLAAPEEPALDGELLGDYRLLREIGRGGMAVVYEAEQLSLGRRVALKVLPFAAVLDPKRLQRFKNEAQAAAHLNHPHIVPVYAVGCERGVHYYAMQQVDGQSLAVAIRGMKAGGAGEGNTTPISSHDSNRELAYIRLAATLGAQAARALDHAHDLGVVHRDVKPGNLLVDRGGKLWVTDFGLAQTLKDVGLTMTGELLGTIRYMSPEQALAKRVPVDHRTDVYSLGATLYELLTLEPAFPGDDPHLLIQDIAFREPVAPRRINPALPRDLETVLLKAMAKDPAARYATMQEFADDLERHLGDRPIRARRPGPLRRAAQWSRRHRALVGAATVVLLLAVAGLAIGTALLWQEKQQTTAAFERAEANLALALRALDQVYVDEAEGHPRVRPGLPTDLLQRGLGFYEEFAAQNADNPDVMRLLGNALHRAGLLYRKLGQEDRAVEALDRAVSRHRAAAARWPADAEVRRDLGATLLDAGDAEGARTECRAALRIAPGLARAHLTLGFVLWRTGDPKGAIGAYGEAIRLEPRLAMAYSNLGVARFETGDVDGAIREYRTALLLEPNIAEAHSNLGHALFVQGDDAGSIRACREAIRLDAGLATAHGNLANALARSGALDEAIREYREALRLKPDLDAHYGLGNALDARGDADGAIAEYREAIRLRPGDAESHCNLGALLVGRGDLDAAIGELREAVRLKPGGAEAHANLANALASRGDFAEALGWMRKADELGSRRADWAWPTRQWIELLERKVELDARLDEVLAGGKPPRDAIERIALTEILYARARYADAARMYADAFAGDAALADDLTQGHRYNAACCAARAATEDQPAAAAWRERALAWLAADLAAHRNAPEDLAPTLAHWKQDPDLANVRDDLESIPEPARAACGKLWAEVDALLARAGAAAAR